MEFRWHVYFSFSYHRISIKRWKIFKVKDIPKVKDDLSILVTNAEGKRKKIVIENPIITKHNSIQKELEDFYHCILENQKPKVSLLDGARALEVAKKIMECI